MRLITWTRNEFPQNLAQIPDSPKTLNILSESLDALNGKLLAVAGTRKPTYLAENLCRQVVEWADATNVTLITGLADGIDTHILKLGLEKKVKMIGVLPSAIPAPVRVHGWHRKMIELGGMLVSEVDPMMGFGKYLYIKRNRIIAGLAPATLIIQAGLPSGSLHTARFANDYNREVFTYPALPLMSEYAGNNWLIKNHLAQPIEHIYELGVAMNWNDKSMLEQQLSGQLEIKDIGGFLPQFSAAIYNLLREGPLSIHVICDIMQVSYESVLQAVNFLVISRVVRLNSHSCYEISDSRIAR